MIFNDHENDSLEVVVSLAICGYSMFCAVVISYLTVDVKNYVMRFKFSRVPFMVRQSRYDLTPKHGCTFHINL